jgi:hypothetical protein
MPTIQDIHSQLHTKPGALALAGIFSPSFLLLFSDIHAELHANPRALARWSLFFLPPLFLYETHICSRYE